MIRYPRYKYFYFFSDFIILISGFIISKFIYDEFYLSKNFIIQSVKTYDLVFLFAASFVFIFIFHYNNLYKINIFLTRSLQLVTLIKSLLYGIILLIVFSYIFKRDLIPDSRLYIVIFFHTTVFLFFFIRVLFLRYIYIKYLSNSIFKKNVLIIGAGKSGRIFAQKLMFENIFGGEVIGFIDDNLKEDTVVFKGIKVIGTTDDLETVAKKFSFNEIAICIDKIDYDRLMDIIYKCHNLKIITRVVSGLFGIIPKKIFAEEYSDIPVVDVSPKLNHTLYYIIKRTIDYTGAWIGLIILSPFFLIVMPLIRLTSKGPAIYKQKRIGKNGKIFNFLKFRSLTMIQGEDEERERKMLDYMNSNTKAEKIVTDSRITKIGKFLRKYSLDELPQLINVLKGDMSLVGPRPCLPYEFDNYDEWQKRRLTVLPGCTGLWQVTGRNNTSFNDSVIIDIYYINNVTPWLDLQLILKTFPVMIFARGGK